MAFVQVKKTENVMVKINYIKSKSNEELKGFYDTADYSFWKDFHIESGKRYRNSLQGRKQNKGVAEGSHLIIGIPEQYELTPALVELVCKHFKMLYGVECCGAAHFVEGNKHIHLIVADRLLLNEPIIIEEKRAERNYYYGADGKKCHKAEAVKVLAKGTVTQEGYTQKFGEKISFIGRDFIQEYTKSLKANVLPEMKFTDITRSFLYTKAGHKPSAFTQRKNALTKALNTYFEKVEQQYGLLNNGYYELTPKEYFLRKYELKSYRYILKSEIDEIERVFALFKMEYPIELEQSTEYAPELPEAPTSDFNEPDNIEHTPEAPKQPEIDLKALTDDELEDKYIETVQSLAEHSNELWANGSTNDTTLLEQIIEVLKELIDNLLSELRSRGYQDYGIARLNEEAEKSVIDMDF